MVLAKQPMEGTHLVERMLHSDVSETPHPSGPPRLPLHHRGVWMLVSVIWSLKYLHLQPLPPIAATCDNANITVRFSYELAQKVHAIFLVPILCAFVLWLCCMCRRGLAGMAGHVRARLQARNPALPCTASHFRSQARQQRRRATRTYGNGSVSVPSGKRRDCQDDLDLLQVRPRQQLGELHLHLR
ncbi:uncharacterized protein SEPMUDRAFT_149179 [Sphaerulina musiva SO2202]|uniref:Uncharacterized protein n=1 Tax=Sphaerulina musiva (strain SO2202) TaxID=692275 RepID=M3CFD4_SPHMS|nr:uncharacterized protein SEPMUDRAFT_149179 [Sphaerulina musiva SO2202]EMF12533.1 hypothetical protein SEPMUDRAFT_149179 [Sphaerulina musiva SO2202]